VYLQIKIHLHWLLWLMDNCNLCTNIKYRYWYVIADAPAYIHTWKHSNLHTYTRKLNEQANTHANPCIHAWKIMSYRRMSSAWRFRDKYVHDVRISVTVNIKTAWPWPGRQLVYAPSLHSTLKPFSLTVCRLQHAQCDVSDVRTRDVPSRFVHSSNIKCNRI
jgi:hypothetical protein